MKKSSVLLADFPVEIDQFGPHAKIADQVSSLVSSCNIDGTPEPHSIALLGDWGSGKSSIISMLRRSLLGSGAAHVFVYDAWAHEGDGLRRAFLDSLYDEFSAEFREDQREKLRSGIWDHHEKTTTINEPILRPHGRAILLALLLSPTGLALFSRYPDAWPDAYGWLWSVLMIFVAAAPLVVLVYYAAMKSLGSAEGNKKRFGVQSAEELSDVRLSSVFLNKSSGSVDRKRVTNPDSSVRQFREAFREICHHATMGSRRLVIVVDNIDRLGRNEARAFWSTMQAFFDRTGWSHDQVMKNVWLLVPFSLQAVEHFFATSTEAASDAKSFVAKTFDLSFHVPAPIQVGFRHYLLSQLSHAFPEHDRIHLENVRDLYDRARADDRPIGSAGDSIASRRTPREVKLFVNQLVALYRTQSDEVTLEAMATYLLKKEEIEERGLLRPDLVSSYQASLMPRQPDVVHQLAAVHFTVDLRTAAQIILSPKILTAIEDEDTEEFNSLSGRSGFVDALEIIASDAESSRIDFACRAAMMVASLDDASDDKYNSIWIRLSRQLEDATIISGARHYAGSLPSLLAHIGAEERARLVRVLVRKLSTNWPPDPKDAQPTAAYDWAGFAYEVANAVLDNGLDERIWFPRHPKFVTMAIDLLSSMERSIELARIFIVQGGTVNISADVATVPGKKAGPGTSGDFYRFCTRVENLGVDWAAVVKKIVERASTVETEGVASDFEMLAVLTKHWQSGAAIAIKKLIDEGTVGAKLAAVGQQPEAMGAALALVLLFAPSSTIQNFASTGRAGDNLLGALLSGSLPAATVQAAVRTINQSGLQHSILVNLVKYAHLRASGAPIVVQLVASGEKINLTASQLIEVADFMKALGSSTENAFYASLAGKDSLLAGIKKISTSNVSAYPTYKFLSQGLGWTSQALKTRLAGHVGSVPIAEWVQELANPGDTLITIAEELKGHLTKFSLPDQVIEALRQLPKAQVTDSAPTAAKKDRLLALLDTRARAAFRRSLWETARQLKTGEEMSIMLELFGDSLLEERIGLKEAVEGPIRALLKNPSRDAAIWLQRWVQLEQRRFSHDTQVAASFRAALNERLRPASGLDGATKTLLRKARTLLPNKQTARRSRTQVKAK